MREVFTRERAVEEGLRKDARINKGFMKRPVNIVYTKRADNPDYNRNSDTVKYIKNTKVFNTMSEQHDIKSHREFYRSMFQNHKRKQKQIDALGRRKEPLSLLAGEEDFKNKTFIVYVEKQHGSSYTLRDIRFNEREVLDVNLGKLYDLAGRAVFMDISRRNGKLKVHQITKMFDKKLQ